MKLLAATLLAFCFLLPAPAAEAWTTKKQYEKWLQSLPAEGPQPTDEYVREYALEYLRRTLKDSESARYEWGAVERGNWKGATERFGTPGWILNVSVNAKNSYGGYTGFTPYKFVYRSGWLVEVYSYHSRYQSWIGHIGVGNELRPLPSYLDESPPKAVEAPPGQMQYRPQLP